MEALVKRQVKVENKTLGKRLAEVRFKSTLADRLVAVEVDALGHKLCMVKTEALVDTLAYKLREGISRPYATHLPIICTSFSTSSSPFTSISVLPSALATISPSVSPPVSSFESAIVSTSLSTSVSASRLLGY